MPPDEFHGPTGNHVLDISLAVVQFHENSHSKFQKDNPWDDSASEAIPAASDHTRYLFAKYLKM